MELKACKACKNQVSSIALVCPTCGVPLPGVSPKKEEKEEAKLSPLGCMSVSLFLLVLYLCYTLIRLALD